MRHLGLVLLCTLLTSVLGFAQSDRFFDRMQTQFGQSVKVGDNLTLPPGSYTFQQVREPGQPRVFRVVDRDGKNLGVTAPAENAVYQTSSPNDVPGQTYVVLKQVGNQAYLDQMWFAGQNHGYHFDLAENAKSSNQSATSATDTKTNNQGSQTTATPASPAAKEIIVFAILPSGSGTNDQLQSQSNAASSQSQTTGGTDNSSIPTSTSANAGTSNAGTSTSSSASNQSSHVPNR